MLLNKSPYFRNMAKVGGLLLIFSADEWAYLCPIYVEIANLKK